jgi:ABC-type ATPase involved in cell division
MAFIEQEPVRCKITINDTIFEQVNEFKYLGCQISYEGERYVKNKISKFLQVTGTINNILKPNQVQKSSRMKIYNTLAIPTLIYGREIWTLTQDKSRLKASEIKFLRRTAGYTLLDHKKNENILQELNTTPVLENITKYRHNWAKHVHRMNNSTFSRSTDRV